MPKPKSRPTSMSDIQHLTLKNRAHFLSSLTTTILQPPKPTCGACIRHSRGGGCCSKHSHQPNIEEYRRGLVAEEMSEFIEWLGGEIFEQLPMELRELTYRNWREDEALQGRFSLPLTAECLEDINFDPSIEETLQTYDLIASPDDLKSNLPSSIQAFLLPCLTDYLTPLITPPPATRITKSQADHCELCGRWWIPLSYHHLIPREVHQKVVKRGWHTKEDLQNVAWLCGACHKFVHQFKSNEELAREYYTVERLLEEEDVRKWAGWVGKLRWKGK